MKKITGVLSGCCTAILVLPFFLILVLILYIVHQLQGGRPEDFFNDEFMSS